MKIKYADGKERTATNERAAMRILARQYPDAVFGDIEHNRILVWPNENAAENDDRKRAIAQINP